MKNRIELARYFGEMQFRYGAEIGVAEGRYSRILCENNPHLERLICVDPWRPYAESWRSTEHQDEAYRQAQENLKGLPAVLWRMTSIEAAMRTGLDHLDFVFIDGAHDFDNVMLDIILWARKVRPGGIVSGHDYMFFRNSGVVEAVNRYVEMHKLELNVIWRTGSGHRDDRQPCWWFKK